MDAKDIIQVKNFEPTDNVTFSPVKKNKYGKSVRMFYSRKPLYLQLPKMKAPFGASFFGDKQKYHLDMSCEGHEETLLTKLKLLDSWVINSARENSMEWFGELMDVEAIASKYNSCLRSSDQWPTNFRVKIIKDRNQEGRFSCKFYDESKSEIIVDNENVQEILKKGCFTKTIVECVGVWFNNETGKFGISWKAFQMKIFPPIVSRNISGYSFVDSDSEDDDDEALEPEA